MKRWLLPVPGLVVLLLVVGFCPGEETRSPGATFAAWRVRLPEHGERYR